MGKGMPAGFPVGIHHGLNFLHSDSFLGADRDAGLTSQTVIGIGYCGLLVGRLQYVGRANVNAFTTLLAFFSVYLRQVHEITSSLVL
jgi:hypothetical protein